MTSTESDATAGVEEQPGKRYVWTRSLRPGPGGLDGAVLAALRRGLGKDAGTVPEMWPYYEELTDSAVPTARLRAEHLALGLFAVHQQSKTTSVHRKGVGVGAAIRALRSSGKFSEAAVERRFAAFATASSLAEAGTHLRGLITQLRATDHGLDYTRLLEDLATWQNPAMTGSVRRRWGSEFFGSRKADRAGDADSSEADSENE